MCVAAACGDDDDEMEPSKRPHAGADAAASSDGGKSSDAGRPADAGASQTAGDCVVALHLDDCCRSYEPLPLADVEADECLQAVPASRVFAADLVKRCMAKGEASCDPASCNQQPRPPSRVAVADGSGCRYADECRSDSDCVAAYSVAGCCNCPEPVPASLLESNRCVVLEGTAANERPLECEGCGLPVDCERCLPSAEPRCVARDSFNECLAVTE